MWEEGALVHTAESLGVDKFVYPEQESQLYNKPKVLLCNDSIKARINDYIHGLLMM